MSFGGDLKGSEGGGGRSVPPEERGAHADLDGAAGGGPAEAGGRSPGGGGASPPALQPLKGSPPQKAQELSGRSSKRERKQVELFDGLSGQPANRKRAPQGRGTPVPKFWGALFHRQIQNPFAKGERIAPYLLQMQGSPTGFYVGCPVEVQVNGAWQRAFVGSQRFDGTFVTLLDGSDMKLRSFDKGVRFDEHACGGFSVGRHAQALFEGGIWYVGLVTTVELDAASGENIATVVFEDGDKVVSAVTASDLLLLPQEWSSMVADVGLWGWWGYNKDRVKWIGKTPPAQILAPPLSASANKKKRPLPSKVGKSEDSGAPKTKRQSVAAEPAVAHPKDFWNMKVPNPFGGADVKPHVLQMQGTSSKFYCGCPVEVLEPGHSTGSKRRAGEGKWVKGTVAGLEEGGTQRVVLAGGDDMVVDPESEVIRFDRSASGVYEVGRHVQVLFDGGTWFVGIVMKVTHNAGIGGTDAVEIQFEDGEVLSISASDEDAALLPKEWSTRVAKEGVWGWWGFNTDRLATIKSIKEGKGVLPPPAQLQTLPPPSKQPGARANEGARSGVPAKVYKNPYEAAKRGEILPISAFVPQATDKKALPTNPGGRQSARDRKQRDYSRLASGPRLDSQGQPVSEDEDEDEDEDEEGPVELNSLSLAVSFCDSLRPTAFVETWADFAARNKWKQSICRPNNTLEQFGGYMKTFEAKLAHSAMVSSYNVVKPSLLRALATVHDEEHARLCVQMLAGNVNPILFKSEQQRKMCSGPFFRR